MRAPERTRILRALDTIRAIVEEDGARAKRVLSPAQAEAFSRGRAALKLRRIAGEEAKLQRRLAELRKERGE